jgi:hypothetical protein
MICDKIKTRMDEIQSMMEPGNRSYQEISRKACRAEMPTTALQESPHRL